ncbi:hypothetical protein J2Z32_000978 [Paenibacillus turicensis]|uniref:DUF3397 domain-containing protein n=1 Tax=Paenibacillus turicensis TaxID=160487 RepID=A0ABS4FP58_9BACL|nr:DUF3397 domain-containing protein [Paenibacillus turicensis]MBP1904361.1 hypothetical protein [Paenibacillus turicensis]
MKEIILVPLIILSILPVVPFLGVYYFCSYLDYSKKAAIMRAMDVTTFFLIISVSALFNMQFGSNFGFYLILLILLITGGLIGGAQNRKKGKIDMRLLLRAVWRITFAGTGVAYILLFLMSMLTYITSA